MKKHDEGMGKLLTGGAALMLGGVIVNLAFWLALIAGILWLLKHFGVIK